MTSRTRTLASFFSIAMATTLLAAVVTTQIQQPQTALARPAEPAAAPVESRGGAFGLDTFRDIARRIDDGVVNINTRTVVKREDMLPDDFFHRFFGPQGEGGGPRSQTQTSLGTGFVIDKDGYILTNRHVVDGADAIQVTFSNQKQYDAKLVGRDARTDVALLKIEPDHELTVLPLGDSDLTSPGEWVMAVGNPFGLGGNSVTVGVVSYKGRPLTLGTQGTSVEMIQTDASINPGNSGGPLLDTMGRVIGINTLIITRGLPQSAGVGFAVPINVAKDILPQLREKGKVVRGWLGIQIQNVTADIAKSLGLDTARGAIISDVTPGSPAEKADLRPGDVITEIDGRPMADNSSVSGYIAAQPPGQTVKVVVMREGKPVSLEVTLGTFPDEETAATAEQEPHAQLGMTLQDLRPEIRQRLELPRGTQGVVVTGVEAGEPAELAGLQRFDVIVSVNGRAVASVDEFVAAVDAAREDGVALLRVWRGGSHLFLTLKLK